MYQIGDRVNIGDASGKIFGLVEARYFFDMAKSMNPQYAEELHNTWGDKYYGWQDKYVYYVDLDKSTTTAEDYKEMWPDASDEEAEAGAQIAELMKDSIKILRYVILPGDAINGYD